MSEGVGLGRGTGGWGEEGVERGLEGGNHRSGLGCSLGRSLCHCRVA